MSTKHFYISLLNVAGALQRPNGPKGVVNTVVSLSRGSTSTFQLPLVKLRVEYQVAAFKHVSESSMQGRGRHP